MNVFNNFFSQCVMVFLLNFFSDFVIQLFFTLQGRDQKVYVFFLMNLLGYFFCKDVMFVDLRQWDLDLKLVEGYFYV